jgi:hypothetical protein
MVCAIRACALLVPRAMTSPHHPRSAARRRWQWSGLILAASLLVPACGAVEPPPPPTAPTLPSKVPTSLVLTASSGFNQQVDVTARVLSADGQGVSNVTVSFSIGAGSITPATTPTDASGTAHATAITTANTTVAAAINGIASSMPLLRSID